MNPAILWGRAAQDDKAARLPAAADFVARLPRKGVRRRVLQKDENRLPITLEKNLGRGTAINNLADARSDAAGLPLGQQMQALGPDCETHGIADGEPYLGDAHPSDSCLDDSASILDGSDTAVEKIARAEECRHEFRRRALIDLARRTAQTERAGVATRPRPR